MNQILNERQWRFLRAAEVAAGIRNRFFWREVGNALGYAEQESREIIGHLDRLAAIALPTDREGQLLPLGRTLSQLPLTPPRPATATHGRRQSQPSGKNGVTKRPPGNSASARSGKKDKSRHRAAGSETWKRSATPARRTSRRASEQGSSKSQRRSAKAR